MGRIGRVYPSHDLKNRLNRALSAVEDLEGEIVRLKKAAAEKDAEMADLLDAITDARSGHGHDCECQICLVLGEAREKFRASLPAPAPKPVGKCPHCNGRGVYEKMGADNTDVDEFDCEECGGTGKAPIGGEEGA